MKNTLIIAGLMTATLAMAQPQPISYSNLVKTGTKLAEGVLPIYQHDNRVYMEFDRQLDGREMDELLAVLDGVKPEECKALMEETLPSQFQEAKVRAFLVPMLDEIVSRRERFALPTSRQISEALVKFEQDAEEKPTV